MPNEPTDRVDGTIAARDRLALLLAATFWGVGTVMSKGALAEIAPVTVLAIQLASSLVVLAILMRAQGVPLRGAHPAALGRLGILNPGIAYALGLLGLATITASVSVLLWALEPLMIMFLAAIFLGERITPRLLLMSFVAIAGIVLVVYAPATGTSQWIGVGLTLAGIACCAAYTIIARRFLPGATETGQVVLAQQAYALIVAVVLVALAGIAGGQVIPTNLTAIGLASAIGSGILYFAGAYWFYLGALRRVPASLASASFYVIPVVGMAGGALLLGERLDVRQWVGALLVLVAVLIVFRLTLERDARDIEPSQVAQRGSVTS